MKGRATLSLSLALAFGAFACPHFARAVDAQNNQPAPAQAQDNSAQNNSARSEAAEMVPATVNLKKGIDARKLHPGDRFQAVLQHDVQLKNGPKLKGGTVLTGTVVADQVQSGNTRLALRFTRAEMKDGKSIPIKATVIEIARPEADSGVNVGDETGLWSPTTLRVDQIGAVSGVDLHSAIASHNSAVLVSNKKDDVKLSAGSQMVLAIAARQSSNSNRGA